MRKWIIIASTAFVWTAGVAAAAALSYVVRTPDPVVVKSEPVVAKLPAPPVLAANAVQQPERVIVLPTVEIVGTAYKPAPKSPAKAQETAQPRDIHEMHCTPFRPLEQGSSSVQICD